MGEVIIREDSVAEGCPLDLGEKMCVRLFHAMQPRGEIREGVLSRGEKCGPALPRTARKKEQRPY